MSIGGESYGIGDNRALDTLGAVLYYHAPRYFDMYVRAHFFLMIDPLPDTDDGYDLLRQTVEASDRSSRVSQYSLGCNELYGTRLKLDYIVREFSSSAMSDGDYTDLTTSLGYTYKGLGWVLLLILTTEA